MAVPGNMVQQQMQFARVKITGTETYRTALLQALSIYPYLVFRSGTILVNPMHMQLAMQEVVDTGASLIGGVDGNQPPEDGGIVLPGGNRASSFTKNVISPTSGIASFLLGSGQIAVIFAQTGEGFHYFASHVNVINGMDLNNLDADMVMSWPLAVTQRQALLNVLSERFKMQDAPTAGSLSH